RDPSSAPSASVWRGLDVSSTIAAGRDMAPVNCRERPDRPVRGAAGRLGAPFGTVISTMTASTRESAPGRLAALKRRYEPDVTSLRNSETAKAGGLAAAMIVNNVTALSST